MFLVSLLGLMLFLVELVSVLVYLDLLAVIRAKKHLFDPLLAMISEKQRKVYQGVYRRSLVRSQFCVSDKVDVSGSTFNTVLLGANSYSLMVNVGDFFVLSSGIHFQHLLWINALVWLVYSMYALVAYRDMRELCFYCKFSLTGGLVHLVLLSYFNGEVAYWLFSLMALVAGAVLLSTQAARMDRLYTAKQRQKDQAERKRQAEDRRLLEERLKAEEDAIEVIECPGHDSQI